MVDEIAKICKINGNIYSEEFNNSSWWNSRFSKNLNENKQIPIELLTAKIFDKTKTNFSSNNKIFSSNQVPKIAIFEQKSNISEKSELSEKKNKINYLVEKEINNSSIF